MIRHFEVLGELFQDINFETLQTVMQNVNADVIYIFHSQKLHSVCGNVEVLIYQQESQLLQLVDERAGENKILF